MKEEFGENNFPFTENGVTMMIPEKVIKFGGMGFGVSICSEKERKLAWMRDTMFRLFMQMELLTCRDELDWLM